ITAERAYHANRKAHCMYGAFAAVVLQLAEKHGEPYRSFPLGMLRYGAGGVSGSGSLCGALNGSAALIGLFVTDEDEMKALVNELFLWYEQSELPGYAPDKPALDAEIPKSVSESVLCHVSVTRWCRSSGHKAFSEQRKERCARLTAQTAARTVELLNAHFAGDFAAAHDLDDEVKACKSCHTKGSEKSDSRGRMHCGSCHFSLAPEHPQSVSMAPVL
ncbi:MAG: C-GCAxxG-C-C family (seleno)protein, partial [Planctomycetota bacterium]